MGQKIDPRGFRLAVTKDWSSRWYANNKTFPVVLQEDLKIREFLTEKFGRRAAIGRIVIERPAKSIKVTLFTARPGVIIGKKGEGIEQIKQDIQKFATAPLHLNVEEIRKPELNAQIVADSVAMQVEKRVAFRRAMKRAMQTTMKMGAIGIKIKTSGRLNGVDIARSEWYREGRVPLHTLRANVDYATSEANTTFGIIGIKVWIYKGDMNLTKTKFVKRTVSEDGVASKKSEVKVLAKRIAEKSKTVSEDKDLVDLKKATKSKVAKVANTDSEVDSPKKAVAKKPATKKVGNDETADKKTTTRKRKVGAEDVTTE